MKLLQRDRVRLQGVLQQLKRGQDYLMNKSILVAKKRSYATTTEDFTNQKGEICCAINKDIGSELALLHSGIAELTAILEG